MAGGSYPRISKGLGELTPSLWDRLMTALEFVEQEGPTLQRVRPDRRGAPASGGLGVKLFRVLDVEGVGADRWQYGWELIRLDGIQFAPDPSGLTHLEEGYGRALNPEEAANNGITHGYGILYSTPAGSLTPQPLEVGSIVPGVLFRDGLDSEALLRPVFMPATNPLVVECANP